MVLPKISRNEAQSSHRAFQPRLTLIAPRANSGATCIALKTWDGVTFPEEQAEPDETATPSMSNDIRSRCASIQGKAKQSVFGSRSSAAPKTTASGAILAIS